jgi:hypothetical protein
LTKNAGVGGGMEWTSAAGASDATTTSKGIVQLAGDLGGTAAAPTVPSLTTNADSSITIIAGTGLSGGGDLTTNRTLSANFGSTAGTVAQGNDSRIINAVSSTIVDTKGDLLAVTAAETLSRLASGSDGQLLATDSTQVTEMKWTTPSADLAEYYPVSAYGFVAIADTISSFGQTPTSESGVIRLFVPAGKAITAVGAYILTADTLAGGGLNAFAV